MALLTFSEAARIASVRFRRSVDSRTVHRWAVTGCVGLHCLAGEDYIGSHSLDTWLNANLDEWRLLTIPEATRRVQELTKVLPSVETVRTWCIRGHLDASGNRVVLPAVKDGRRRLIDPKKLRAFVRDVVRHNGVGRPLGKRRVAT